MNTIPIQRSSDDAMLTGARASSKAGKLLPRLVAAIVLCAGVVECWYGRTDQGAIYGSDAVQYLDIARALEGGHWVLAMNPLWGFGYPLLLALVHPLFPAGAAGDLLSVRILNLAIFVATGFSFWYLIRGVIPATVWKDKSGSWREILLIGSACLFCATQICIDKVSRVGPDQLLACLFFLTCGLTIRLIRSGKASLALLCGLTMGFGYITKAAFLPLGCFVLLMLCVALRRKVVRLWHVAICGAAFAGLIVLYASGLSAALGRPTLGEAGSINYAWNVNRLAKWVHWEGGTDPASRAWPKASVARFADWANHPPDFGKPIHPTPILGSDPKIFAFGEPFAVTYPPYYDPPWWYEGYRHFFNWRYQAISVGYNLLQLGQVLVVHPMFYAAVGVVLLLALARKRTGDRRWAPWRAEEWSLWLFALASVVLFIPVHLEGRYIAPALAVLAMVPLTSLLVHGPELSRSQRRTILTIFMIGVLLEVGVSERDTLRRIAGHGTAAAATQWRAAGLLADAGLRPDTRIATISWEPSVHCDWAYEAGLHITGEIATGEDWKQFWNLTPEMQRQVLERFRSTGATAVVAWYKPDSTEAQGWHQMGDLPLWLYRL